MSARAVVSPMLRRIQRFRIELVKDGQVTFPLNDQSLKGPYDLATAARAVAQRFDREVFLTLYLNRKHVVTGIEIIAVGTLDQTLVHPREVFKGALLHNAAAVALAHLHPSGDPTPSQEDHRLTDKLLKAGEVLGITVVDHVVIGDPGHVSLRETTDLWRDNPFHT